MEGTGLRDRKKVETRRALYTAATRLAVAHGLERVTVEAIADEANVSRRTFSNYFASKEEALLYGYRAHLERLVDGVRDRPPTEPPWRSVRTAVHKLYAESGNLTPQEVTRSRLIRRHHSLHAEQLALHAEFESALAAELTTRTGDRLGASLMAAVVLAVIRIAIDEWLERAGADPLPALVDRALTRAGQPFD